MINGKAAGLVGPPKTEDYRPTVSTSPSFTGGVAWAGGSFQPAIIDEMRKDEQVDMCLGYKTAPLHQVEFTINAKSSEEKQFVAETVERFWRKDLDIALTMLPYGYSGSEALYKKEGDLVKYDCLRQLHARDVKAWTERGQLRFVRVQGVKGRDNATKTGPVDLEAATANRPAKGVWFRHQPEYSPWYGRSVLLPAWIPWRAKQMPDGGIENLVKFAYKHAYSGYEMRHPDLVYADTPGGATVRAENHARQMAEQLKAGGIVTFSNARDDAGNFLWQINQYAKIEGDFSKLIEYIEFLNRLIARACGIPDEVLQHDGNTGGFSRSKVALMAFYLSAERLLAAVLDAFDRQILRPLVRLDFKYDTYSIKPGRLIPPDEEQDQPGGAQVPGGIGGAELGDQQVPGDEKAVASASADPLAGLMGGPKQMAVQHAPAGGVTVGGQFYAGGEFIPAEVVASATKAEKSALAGKPKKAPRVKEQKPSEKAARAKAAHKLVDKDIQRYAEDYNEPRFAKLVGGRSYPNSEPVDVTTRSGDGVELKTMVDNSNDKITMDSYSQVRKIIWEQENDRSFHTVISDDRAVYNAKGEGQHDNSGRRYFYRRGVAGSARIANMYECQDEKELLKLMKMPEDKLPLAARRTDGKHREGQWQPFVDDQGKGYRNETTGKVVRAKK